VAGVFAGTLIWHSALAQRSRWLFALVAGLLALGLAAVAPGPLPGWFGIVVLSLAMGIMNTTVTRVGEQQVSLGYVTGTLNNLAQHLALAVKGAPLSHAEGPHDTHLRRAGIWTAFVIGALLAGAATPNFAAWSLLLPIVILSVLAVSGRPFRA
jgi:uncharacterized membrane protein YoaK (UPF0700 family)